MAQEYIQLVGKQSFHTGIDLVGNTGSKVLSVKNGEITHAGWQYGYGNCDDAYAAERGNGSGR